MINRRQFIQTTGAAALAAGVSTGTGYARAENSDYGPMGHITEIEGVRVGHFTDSRKPTGCTVILCESGAVGGVDVRGGAPGTRETDLLNPVNMVEKIHAVVLSGGSAFGLDTASGVMRYLEERNIGFDVRIAKVPIVPAAILFDLGVGDPKIRPDAASGYAACMAATSDSVAEGSVGAGAGATVGKAIGGAKPMKGGIGNVCLTTPDGLKVGAIIAVNAVGDVYDYKNGRLLAGARTPDGRAFVRIADHVRTSGSFRLDARPQNTTIGAIVTNAKLTKTEVNRVAQVGHDGLARAINPAHLQGDGDTLFALATGSHEPVVSVSLVAMLAATAVSEAIIRAIVTAAGIPGYPSYQDIKEG